MLLCSCYSKALSWDLWKAREGLFSSPCLVFYNAKSLLSFTFHLPSIRGNTVILIHSPKQALQSPWLWWCQAGQWCLEETEQVAAFNIRWSPLPHEKAGKARGNCFGPSFCQRGWGWGWCTGLGEQGGRAGLLTFVGVDAVFQHCSSQPLLPVPSSLLKFILNAG